MKPWISLLIFLGVLAGCTPSDEAPKQETSPSEHAETQQPPQATSSSDTREIIFDEADSETIETITSTVLTDRNEDRKNLNIRMYTLDAYTKRSIWLAEATFRDGNTSYWLYIVDADRVTEIHEGEFTGKRKGIQKSNNSDIPFYEEENY